MNHQAQQFYMQLFQIHPFVKRENDIKYETRIKVTDLS